MEVFQSHNDEQMPKWASEWVGRELGQMLGAYIDDIVADCLSQFRSDRC